MLDERIELLITRRLDDRLTESEALELNKALIRSPEARRFLEDCQRIDDLARTALCTATEYRPVATASGPSRSILRSLRWFGSAVAAVLLITVFARSPLPERQVPPAGEHNTITNAITVSAPVAEAGLTSLIDGPRRENERLLRDVIGVLDPRTSNVYLLEMDRQQTVVTADTMNF